MCIPFHSLCCASFSFLHSSTLDATTTSSTPSTLCSFHIFSVCFFLLVLDWKRERKCLHNKHDILIRTLLYCLPTPTHSHIRNLAHTHTHTPPLNYVSSAHLLKMYSSHRQQLRCRHVEVLCVLYEIIFRNTFALQAKRVSCTPRHGWIDSSIRTRCHSVVLCWRVLWEIQSATSTVVRAEINVMRSTTMMLMLNGIWWHWKGGEDGPSEM